MLIISSTSCRRPESSLIVYLFSTSRGPTLKTYGSFDGTCIIIKFDDDDDDDEDNDNGDDEKII